MSHLLFIINITEAVEEAWLVENMAPVVSAPAALGEGAV
jgi:hypothetical protein